MDKKQGYKVGDKVVVTGNKYYMHGFILGTLCKIVEIESNTNKYILQICIPDTKWQQCLYEKDFSPNFKINDSVKIKKGTRFYDENSRNNPKNQIGKVIEINNFSTYDENTLPVTVKWKYEENRYNFEDLQFPEILDEIEVPKVIIQQSLNKLSEIEQKNQVLITVMGMFKTRIRFKANDILTQLSFDSSEYIWDINSVINWMNKISLFKLSKAEYYTLIKPNKIDKYAKKESSRKYKIDIKNRSSRANKK